MFPYYLDHTNPYGFSNLECVDFSSTEMKRGENFPVNFSFENMEIISEDSEEFKNICKKYNLRPSANMNLTNPFNNE